MSDQSGEALHVQAASHPDHMKASGAGEKPPDPSSLLQPPHNCISVTADRGVLRFVREAGYGATPSLHARCLVHYVGRLAATGEVFIDTEAESASREPSKLVAGRDSSATDVGLNLAVATMCVGERATVYIVDPKYGYGAKGSFSFPSVPPDSALVYDVQLLGAEDVNEEGEDKAGLLFEERLERAERRRLQGNTLFAQAKYREALAKYAVALSYLDEDFMYQLEGSYLSKAEAVKVPIHLNMAACQIKSGDPHTAIYNCTQALLLEPNSVKALFRRGTARHKLQQTDEALADLQAANAKAPDDKAILKELQAVRQTMKEEKKASDKLFKGQFGATPQPCLDPKISDRQGIGDGEVHAASSTAQQQTAVPAAPASVAAAFIRISHWLSFWLFKLFRLFQAA